MLNWHNWCLSNKTISGSIATLINRDVCLYTGQYYLSVMPQQCWLSLKSLTETERIQRGGEWGEENTSCLSGFVGLCICHCFDVFWMIYIVNNSVLGSLPSPEMAGWWRQRQTRITLNKLLVQHPHHFPHYHIQTFLRIYLSHCSSVCILVCVLQKPNGDSRLLHWSICNKT